MRVNLTETLNCRVYFLKYMHAFVNYTEWELHSSTWDAPGSWQLFMGGDKANILREQN